MDNKIDKIEQAIVPLKEHALYQDLEKKLKEDLANFNKSTLLIKGEKYWRDKNAFHEGKGYKRNNIGIKRKPYPQKNYRFQTEPQGPYYPSDSSASSVWDNTRTHRGCGRSKRSGKHRSSLEQDNKKCTVDTEVEHTQELVNPNWRKLPSPYARAGRQGNKALPISQLGTE